MKKGITHVGLDVHKETIVAAVLCPGRRTAEVTKFGNDDAAVRRFVRKLRKDGRQVAACYEAGPNGFALQRLLLGLGLGIGSAGRRGRARAAAFVADNGRHPGRRSRAAPGRIAPSKGERTPVQSHARHDASARAAGAR